MPGTDGVEAARAIARSRAAALPPAIVFTTGFPDYATRAFDIGAVDYVLKPLSSSRVRQAMERVRTWLAARHVSPSAVTRAPVRGAAATGTLVDGATAVVRRVFIPAGDHSIAVAPEHIRFI
jgi:DNA-binding LytR/AlgR family response regulator